MLSLPPFHDHSHAHAVFIELTFGLNTIFAIYTEFRGTVSKRVGKFVATMRGRFATLEGTRKKGEIDEKEANEIDTLNNHLNERETFHARNQEWIFNIVCWFAVACAVAALWVLYWDQIHLCGHWCALLLLPFPTYAACILMNFWWFRSSVMKKLRVYDEFVKNFHPSMPALSKIRISTGSTRQRSIARILLDVLMIFAVFLVAGFALWKFYLEYRAGK